jgi:DNA repair protein RadC
MKTDYFTVPEITVSYKDTVKASQREAVRHADDAARILAAAFEGCMEHHEEMYALFLNKANRVLGISKIAQGGIDSVAVDIRIILQTALKVNASSLMISHNHPSGNKQPSPQDIEMTNKLRRGCQAIDINLLDHIIITSESYTSFADEGLI